MLSTNVTFSLESTVKAMYWVIHYILEKSKKIGIDEDGNIRLLGMAVYTEY